MVNAIDICYVYIVDKKEYEYDSIIMINLDQINNFVLYLQKIAGT